MMEQTNLVPKRRFKEFQNTSAWEQRKLGELADIVRGASPRPIQDPKWFDVESDVGWLRIADVTEQDGRIHYLEQRISKAGQEKTRVLTEPHLLLSIAATVGKPVVNYVKTGVHDGFLIFQNPKFEREFIFQWLEMFRPKWQKYGQPGSQVNLNSDLVKDQEIMLPSEVEQKRIGSFFGQLDHLITLHQRKLEKTKELKAGYLSEMFPAEGECEPKRRFAGFTGAWEQRELSELANFTKGSGYTKGDLRETGAPIILYGRLYTDYETLIENVNTFVDEKENSIISLGGEVIVPSSGESAEDIARASVVGKPGIILGGDLNIIKPSEKIDPVFLALAISNGAPNKEMAKRAQGKSVVHLHNSDLKKINLTYPQIGEQRNIVEFYLQLDNLITLHQRKLEKLQNIKKAYLNEMFV